MVWDDTVSVYMDVWSKIVVDEVLVDDTSLMPGQHLCNINIGELCTLCSCGVIIR